jgi:hypothetical protein
MQLMRVIGVQKSVAAARDRTAAATCMLLLAGIGAFGPAPVWSHHGAAAYDRASRVEIQGIVQRFDWVNPHGLIEIASTDTAGQPEHWTAETAGLVILVRAGWSRNVLVPGERCTMIGFPARNGSHTMILERLVLGNGRELTNFVP